MGTHFHRQLNGLRLKVLEMAAYTSHAIESVAEALQNRDAALAREVIEGDLQINQLECEVDEMSLRLIALEQPMAVDLRAIVATMRMAMHLERIGDECANVAKNVLYLSESQPLPNMDHLIELATQAMHMTHKAVDSFRENDLDAARGVRPMDKRCNALEKLVQQDMYAIMREDPSTVERGMHAVFAARSLERVGDLSNNIAETVMFIVAGLNIKHDQQQMN